VEGFKRRNNEDDILPGFTDAKSQAGADIRFLMDGKTGNMIHSTVPPHQVNQTVEWPSPPTPLASSSNPKAICVHLSPVVQLQQVQGGQFRTDCPSQSDDVNGFDQHAWKSRFN
jgi:hypothetical protein